MENNVDLMGVVTAKQARSYGGLSPQIFASPPPPIVCVLTKFVRIKYRDQCRDPHLVPSPPPPKKKKNHPSYASTAKYYFRDDKIEILFTKYTSKYRVF